MEVMDTTGNKAILHAIFDELAKGNGRPFVDAMADDFVWTLTGSSRWSKTFRGKRAVRTQLLAPLFAQFVGVYTNTAARIHADGDYVIVECRGDVTTKEGKPYRNHYCYVVRMAGGKMQEITEYMDTALVDAVLKAPA
jgi:ketosteroid isomerase-like protein